MCGFSTQPQSPALHTAEPMCGQSSALVSFGACKCGRCTRSAQLWLSWLLQGRVWLRWLLSLLLLLLLMEAIAAFNAHRCHHTATGQHGTVTAVVSKHSASFGSCRLPCLEYDFTHGAL